MKSIASLLILFSTVLSLGQTSTNNFEKYPVFPECMELEINALENCFKNTLNEFVFSNFNVPEIVAKENYKGSIKVFFEVDKEGKFNVLYVDAIYNDLKDEVRKVFSKLPQITPATYNGNPSFVQFTMPITEQSG